MLEKGIAIGYEGYLGEVLWQFPKRTKYYKTFALQNK